VALSTPATSPIAAMSQAVVNSPVTTTLPAMPRE
jgi:hypothetical protein